MEIECTHCGGRMLVEEIDNVVACPHCDTHLTVPPSPETDGPPSNAEGRSSVLTEAPSDSESVTRIGRLVSAPEDSVIQTSIPLEPSDQLPDAEEAEQEPEQEQEEELLTFPVLTETSPPPDAVDVPMLSDSPPIETPPAASPPVIVHDTETVPANDAPKDEASQEEAPNPFLPPAEAVADVSATPEEMPFHIDTTKPKEAPVSPPENPAAPVSAEETVPSAPPKEQNAKEQNAKEQNTEEQNTEPAAEFSFPTLTTDDSPVVPPIESVNISEEAPSPAEPLAPPVVVTDVEAVPAEAVSKDKAPQEEAPNPFLPPAEAVADVSAMPEAMPFHIDTTQPKEAPVSPPENPAAPVSATAPISAGGTFPSGPLEGQKTKPAVASSAVVPSAVVPSAVVPPQSVSRFLFVLVVSYASAATLAIIILIISLLRARQHSLESLPDLKPPVHNGKTAFQLVPTEAPMPPGHTLQLGQSQRFGSLRVTPLRVTRGPVKFVYFSKEPGHRRPPTPPTLKLWLRFENISDDQTFSPLGRALVLTRIAGKNSSGHLRANNFVCRADNKQRNGHQVLLFDLAQDSNWDLRAQDVDRVLRPGEVFKTYLASEAEGLKKLTGNLIWRVQFRKGYNRKSKRGVTTLIEVHFDSKEIQSGTTG